MSKNEEIDIWGNLKDKCHLPHVSNFAYYWLWVEYLIVGERTKLPLFAYDMTVYIENLKEEPKKMWLEIKIGKL